MGDIVLDASTTMTLFRDDEEEHLVVPVLNSLRGGSAFVPGIWAFEMANLLAKSVRARRFSRAEARRIAAGLTRLPITRDEAPVDIASLSELAIGGDLSGYDAAYLSLASRLGLPLATNDRRLARAATASGVVLLA